MLKTAISALLFVLTLAMGSLPSNKSVGQAISTPTTANDTNSTIIRFAVIGDFGNGSTDAGRVAKLVKSWIPDFIATVGDNNYAGGKCCYIDRNVGQFYHEFIYPYTGKYGTSSPPNRFFVILGDHDWQGLQYKDHLDFFTLPGNERYYDVAWGPVHLFMLDSDEREPDGNTANSIQAQWLQKKLATSTAPWKLVFLHDPPYSSGKNHGSERRAQWPFREWGATATFSGNDHLYERIVMDGFPYFVNGLGGTSKYPFERSPVVGSQIRYNESYGAQLVTADRCTITFAFYSLSQDKTPVDSYTINRCVDF